ncbi:hypothetical protein A2U01_0064382 [Trifolium medium]|uniref:Uncharacterized protein n=1 Tax=Trifolium medium TaxID=97028 RepID=A0A392S5H7_9FABA|nr:hypothetical protein [Trifolium medium]
MEKMSALERLESLVGVMVLVIDEVDPGGAEEIDRRIRTLIRPFSSVSDWVVSGASWP